MIKGQNSMIHEEELPTGMGHKLLDIVQGIVRVKDYLVPSIFNSGIGHLFTIHSRIGK